MPALFAPDPARAARIQALGYRPDPAGDVRFTACDLCAGTVFATIAEQDRYGFARRFQRCEGCGLVFQNPFPGPAAAADFYARRYRPLLAAYKGRTRSPAELDAKAARAAERVVGAFRAELTSQRIERLADFGGSSGALAGALAAATGARALVVDPETEALARARAAGLDTEQGLIDDWQPAGRRFELVALMRTVDHLPSIARALAKARAVLAPDGRLLIDALDFAGLAAHRRDYRELLKMDHVFSLSDETMRAYLRRGGFRPIATDYVALPDHVLYLCAPDEPAELALPLPGAARLAALLCDRLRAPAAPAPRPAWWRRLYRRLRG